MDPSESSSGKFVVKLSEFKVWGLAKTGSHNEAAKYYLEVNVDDISYKTSNSSVGDDGSTIWNYVIFFDVYGSEMLCLRLYMKQSRKDTLLGEIKCSIEQIPGETHDGVLKRHLKTKKQELLSYEISVVVSSDASGASALDLQFAEAIVQARKPSGYMRVLTSYASGGKVA